MKARSMCNILPANGLTTVSAGTSLSSKSMRTPPVSVVLTPQPLRHSDIGTTP